MKEFCLIIFVSAVIVACSSKMLAPSSEQLVSMQQKVPDITLERAKAGYQLYSEKCASCHHLYSPDRFTTVQWNNILPKMFPKAKVSDTDQQKLIRDYLHALSR